jgi:hypothetical protein
METNQVKDVADAMKAYLNLQVGILRLELVKAISAGLSKVGSVLVLSLLGIMIFLLLTITAGLYLGDLLGSPALGFLSLSGAYALLFAVFAVFGEQLIRRPLRNRIISSMSNPAPDGQ